MSAGQNTRAHGRRPGPKDKPSATAAGCRSQQQDDIIAADAADTSAAAAAGSAKQQQEASAPARPLTRSQKRRRSQDATASEPEKDQQSRCPWDLKPPAGQRKGSKVVCPLSLGTSTKIAAAPAAPSAAGEGRQVPGSSDAAAAAAAAAPAAKEKEAAAGEGPWGSGDATRSSRDYLGGNHGAAAAAIAAEGAVAAAGAAVAAGPAAVGGVEEEHAGPSEPGPVVARTLPVHGAVLSAMSDYFKTLIQSWNGKGKVLQMQVAEDEVDIALVLLQFMYTGKLKAMKQEDMLKLMKLADKYQVKNCPTACARRFADTPIDQLKMETIRAIYEWPSFLHDAEPFAGVLAKARAKLLDQFGDLEVAWQDPETRQQFLKLPFRAVKQLAESDETKVWSENTMLIALVAWMGHYCPSWSACSSRMELAELIRIQHLSPCFLGSILRKLHVLGSAINTDALVAAARYASANEATRAKLHNLPNKAGRMKVLLAPPRAKTSITKLQFEWVLELKEVKQLISSFKSTKVTVDKYSEPHFFNGFHFQFVLQVLEPPAKGHLPGPQTAVDVFIGATARVQVGNTMHLPDVLYFKGALYAREVSSGDFTFVNRMESGFVCGTAGWGFRNFLRITDWDNEDQTRRFFYDGKLHLRCVIDNCE